MGKLDEHQQWKTQPGNDRGLVGGIGGEESHGEIREKSMEKERDGEIVHAEGEAPPAYKDVMKQWSNEETREALGIVRELIDYGEREERSKHWLKLGILDIYIGSRVL